MPLVNSATESGSAKTPDKMICTGVDASAIFYTVPSGRKFIGHAVLSADATSRIFMKPDGGAQIQGGSGTGGNSFPIYLNAGEFLRGQYAGLSGIESDA